MNATTEKSTTADDAAQRPHGRHRLLTALAAAALVLGVTACGKKEAAPPQEAAAEAGAAKETEAKPEGEAGTEGEAGHAAGEEEGTPEVKLDAATMQQMGVELQPVGASAVSEELRAPGEVVESAYGTTLVTPRVVSLVVRRHAKLGDEVRAGAPLVTLSSVEVANAQADLRIAEQESRRVSALGREAVSGRRIAEAQVAADRARAVARAYGLPGTAPGRANGEFTLTAPHAGRITADEFVVGERIEPGKPLFRLVDESTVWVDATLPAGSVPRIAAGSQATVVFNGQRMTGKVLRAAHRTSDATRNAAVRVEVPNRDDILHGGDFVEVWFEAASGTQAASKFATRLTVPNDALVQLQGETVVFRADADGGIAAVPVRTGEVVGGQTLVTDGLQAGDRIVVKGAFAIKSQLLKAQMGSGHGH